MRSKTQSSNSFPTRWSFSSSSLSTSARLLLQTRRQRGSIWWESPSSEHHFLASLVVVPLKKWGSSRAFQWACDSGFSISLISSWMFCLPPDLQVMIGGALTIEVEGWRSLGKNSPSDFLVPPFGWISFLFRRSSLPFASHLKMYMTLTSC